MRKAIGFLSVFLSVALINIPAHAQDSWVIGQSAPLTGGNAAFGKDIRDGALAYFKAVNARGGVKPLLTNFHAPKFVTADLMAEYDAGPAVFKLNVINLADKLYADQLYRGHWVPGQERTVQLTTTVKF